MKKLLCIIGTRPQAIKHIPFQKAMSSDYQLINLHTGQHYDALMKEAFVSNINLDYEVVLSANDRSARMVEMEENVLHYIEISRPDMIIVYGDTDSTLAGAKAAAKSKIPLCHIEAGLRSFNMEMPEEINRIETDKLSQLLLCPSTAAVEQLQSENIVEGVYEVGDIMKDAILMHTQASSLSQEKYYYASLHRPYNVDEENRLRYVLEALNELELKVILPLHPRTDNNMKHFDIQKNEYQGIQFIDPQSYTSNLQYMKGSKLVLTDSGGMQKEAYWLQKKCITLRSETEWKETLHDGCNTLLFDDLSELQDLANKKAGPWNENLYGDGLAAIKIKEVLDDYFKRA